MPEIIGIKPPSRRCKETVVTWISRDCQLISNDNVPITNEILTLIQKYLC